LGDCTLMSKHIEFGPGPGLPDGIYLIWSLVPTRSGLGPGGHFQFREPVLAGPWPWPGLGWVGLGWVGLGWAWAG